MHFYSTRTNNFLKIYTPLFFIWFVFLLLVIRAWPFAWDDSGITLAFSKNLVRFGDIVPTSLTPRVEGYSSFLWMVLNALFFKAGLNENWVLNLAKSIATIFAALNIALFWKITRESLKTPFFSFAALTLYSINIFTISSAADGMETSLYAFLILSSYMLFINRKQSSMNPVLFGFVSSLIILVRHEGILFLIPFVVVLAYERGKRLFFEPIVLIWAFVFISYHTWHYLYFGEILTNPMLAKRFWPYKTELKTLIEFANFYLTPIFEFIFRYIGLFILLGIFFIRNKKLIGINWKEEAWKLSSLIALMAIFIMVITGANWGAANRLAYPGLAFILLLIFASMDNPFLFKSSKLLKISAIIGLIINLYFIAISLSTTNPDVITLAGVEKRASTIDIMQRVLGQQEITFAGVDMGGLLLFHGDGKKVIDLGMLCDRRLAKIGYAQFEDYLFVEMKPEIIEAHGFWLEPLQKSPSFSSMYVPVMTLTKRNEQILYIRRDIFERLSTKFDMPYKSASAGFKDIDQPTLFQLRTFPVLDLKNY